MWLCMRGEGGGCSCVAVYGGCSCVAVYEGGGCGCVAVYEGGVQLCGCV